MDLEERKARILYGQHLTAPADPLTVCRDVNGIQAQFVSAALHALAIRADHPLHGRSLRRAGPFGAPFTSLTR